ncbi:hypothetical protein H4219_005464, partial [Mycoemilia scoparia]
MGPDTTKRNMPMDIYGSQGLAMNGVVANGMATDQTIITDISWSAYFQNANSTQGQLKVNAPYIAGLDAQDSAVSQYISNTAASALESSVDAISTAENIQSESNTTLYSNKTDLSQNHDLFSSMVTVDKYSQPQSQFVVPSNVNATSNTNWSTQALFSILSTNMDQNTIQPQVSQQAFDSTPNAQESNGAMYETLSYIQPTQSAGLYQQWSYQVPFPFVTSSVMHHPIHPPQPQWLVPNSQTLQSPQSIAAYINNNSEYAVHLQSARSEVMPAPSLKRGRDPSEASDQGAVIQKRHMSSHRPKFRDIIVKYVGLHKVKLFNATKVDSIKKNLNESGFQLTSDSDRRTSKHKNGTETYAAKYTHNAFPIKEEQ